MTEPRAADVTRIATDVGLDGADRERRQARWTLAVSAAALVIVPAVAMMLGSSLGFVLVFVLGLPALVGAAHGLASLAIRQLDAGRRLSPGSVAVREGTLHVHVPSARDGVGNVPERHRRHGAVPPERIAQHEKPVHEEAEPHERCDDLQRLSAPGGARKPTPMRL
ncbi:hypothetical protein WMF38_28935 [Sorangium sp. So ce118]